MYLRPDGVVQRNSPGAGWLSVHRGAVVRPDVLAARRAVEASVEWGELRRLSAVPLRPCRASRRHAAGTPRRFRKGVTNARDIRPNRPPFPSESWVIAGLTLQTLSVAGVAAFAWTRLRHQGIGGHLTAATIRLAWHSGVHTRAGLAVLAAGASCTPPAAFSWPAPTLGPRPSSSSTRRGRGRDVRAGALALVVAVVLTALANDAELPFDVGSLRRQNGRPGNDHARGPLGKLIVRDRRRCFTRQRHR